MTTQTMINLTLTLFDPDEDVLDLQVRQLLQEIRTLDEVEWVELVSEMAPEHSKGWAGTMLGALQVDVSLENSKKFFSFLGERLEDKPIEVKLEVNGNKIEIKAASRRELEAIQQTIFALYRQMEGEEK